jgi:hypothetical protein
MMKRFLVFLGLMALALRGMGQVNGPPQHDPYSMDMLFNTTFSALSNSPPPPNDFYGVGIYHHYSTAPYPLFIVTNSFEFTIVSPAPAQAAWILEKQEDGSFMPITNLNMAGGPDEYYFGQAWLLTTNQVRSLVTSNWYAEVDFGDSNYFGNITPIGGQGPFIGYPIIYGVHSLWGVFPISPDNRTANVIFDGSHCEDEFYLPIQCVWTAQAAGSSVPFTVTNLMTTNTFTVGFHTVTIQLSDGVLRPPPVDIQFQVITAGQAVGWIIRGLPVNQLSPKSQKIMTTLLSAASADFNQGQMAAGCAHLHAFEQIVKALHLDSYTASQLLQPAQQIIEAVKNPQPKKRPFR